MNIHLNAVFTLLSLALLWMLLWFYVEYTIDSFRQKVFTLRDEMFDMASSGKIPFNHKAYGRLRSTMNGSIRFAEEISLARLFLVILCNLKNKIQREKFSEKFSAEVENLPLEQKNIFQCYYNRFSQLLVTQLIANSPLTVVLLVVPFMLYLLFRTMSSWFRMPLDEVQSLAYAAGRD